MPPEESKKTRLGTGAPEDQPAPTTPAPQAPPAAAAPTPAPLPTNIPAAGGAYVPPPDPLVGSTLAGRYSIDRKLGEGGMGAVYLAQHITLEKQVALKVLHGEFSRKEDLVERFLQEARSASRIRHENVIDITDFGSTPEGLVFFAMELLKGRDLHEELSRARLEGQPFSWERSRDIFLQICSALSAAHGLGIVHRDLKPENIYLVEWLGHSDFVKLLDFGIAKLTEVNEDDRKLTKTGMLFGTPEYMSPEQARGEKVDHRVDVYAMGCILYQLVVGRVPYEADNFMGILSMHLTDPVPTVDPAALAAVGAPPELGHIIQKALAKDRADRFDSIDDLANAIVAIEQGVPADQVAPVPRRKRTQWTGSVQIPDDGPDHDDADRGPRPGATPGKSKVPLVLALVAVLAAGAVAAVLLTRGSDTAAGPEIPVDDLAPLPARITLALGSDPAGAEIVDTNTKEVLGLTPLSYDLPGSREPRRFLFRLEGHQNKLLEFIPDQDVEYTMSLPPLAAGAAPIEPEVEVVEQPSRPKAPKRPRDVKTPEPKVPEPKTPEPKTPEPKVPETKTPETKVPETKVPETKTPETKTPEPKTPETKPPGTDDPGDPKIKDPFAP